MKLLKPFGVIFLITLLYSCSLFQTQPRTIPLPPQNLAKESQMVTSFPEKASSSSGGTSLAAESMPSKKVQISEDRNNGTVNKIVVDNPGKIPNYTLYPNPNKAMDTDVNQPNKNLTTPSWGYSW